MNTQLPSTVKSSNAVGANAVVAKNAGEGASVVVEFNTVTESGIRKIQRKFTADGFSDWMGKVRCGSQLQGVWKVLAGGGVASVVLPPMIATVREG